MCHSPVFFYPAYFIFWKKILPTSQYRVTVFEVCFGGAELLVAVAVLSLVLYLHSSLFAPTFRSLYIPRIICNWYHEPFCCCCHCCRECDRWSWCGMLPHSHWNLLLRRLWLPVQRELVPPRDFEGALRWFQKDSFSHVFHYGWRDAQIQYLCRYFEDHWREVNFWHINKW